MSYPVVFFDLETTGLIEQHHYPDIIQISAVCGERVFNAYTVPRCRITRVASSITGFTVINGTLFCHGQFVQTASLVTVLNSFINFLYSLPGPVYLAAHNACGLDAPVLIRALREFNLLGKFQGVVDRFLDTLLLSKRLFSQLQSHSLKFLVSRFLRKTYNSHNALEDATVLQELFYKWQPGRKAVRKSLI